jgi:hypothetical protein
LSSVVTIATRVIVIVEVTCRSRGKNCKSVVIVVVISVSQSSIRGFHNGHQVVIRQV